MRFQLLGLLEVVDGGRRIEFVRGKERALLALLLLSSNEPVSTDLVIEALWGDRPPEHATKSPAGDRMRAPVAVRPPFSSIS